VKIRRRLSESGQRAAVLRDGLQTKKKGSAAAGRAILSSPRAQRCARGIVDGGCKDKAHLSLAEKSQRALRYLGYVGESDSSRVSSGDYV
jgi:hypothetical protein